MKGRRLGQEIEFDSSSGFGDWCWMIMRGEREFKSWLVHLPLALVPDERSNYVTKAAGRRFSILFHVRVTPFAANRRCG